jgi:hypothetical protein
MKKVIAMGCLVGAICLLGAGTAAAQSAGDVDWDAVKAAWGTLTEAERAAYEELIAGMTSGIVRTPGDTCGAATHEVGTLPYADSDTTVGLADNITISGTPCAGGGSQFAGTGTGPDIAYRVRPDVTCSVNVNMDPTDVAPNADDLALYVVTDCANPAASCLRVDDAGGAGTAEDTAFSATAGVDHFIIVDGFTGAAGPFNLTITETTSTGCELVPVELQQFRIE